MRKVYVMTERWYEYKYDIVSNTIREDGSEKYVVGAYSTMRKAKNGLIKRVSENGFKPDGITGWLDGNPDKYGIWYFGNGEHLTWHGTYHVENPVFQTKPYTVNVEICVDVRVINTEYRGKF